MSEEIELNKASTPWHLWAVGIVGLLWSAMGALDYVMTQTKNEAYLSEFPAEMLAWVDSLPAWTIAAWAIGVWGGVVGAILLLLRKRLSVWILLASFVAAAVMTFRNYVLADAMEVMGDTFSLVFTAAILLISLALFLYARAMERRGVLT